MKITGTSISSVTYHVEVRLDSKIFSSLNPRLYYPSQQNHDALEDYLYSQHSVRLFEPSNGVERRIAELCDVLYDDLDEYGYLQQQFDSCFNLGFSEQGLSAISLSPYVLRESLSYFSSSASRIRSTILSYLDTQERIFSSQKNLYSYVLQVFPSDDMLWTRAREIPSGETDFFSTKRDVYSSWLNRFL